MTDLVWIVILLVAVLTLPTIGFLIGGSLAGGKLEDTWNEGYAAGFEDGARRA